MSVLFYQRESDARVTPPSAPDGYQWTLWRPTLRNIRPAPDAPARYAVWWVFHQLRVFANRDYAVLVVTHGTEAVHRSAVFPRWLRSPFMTANDLQVGDTWTAPAHRGRGLATMALQCVTAQMSRPARRFWYLVEQGNEASIRAVRRAGFSLAGEGARLPRWGVSALGAYRLQTPTGR